ncbi:hypothetical protein [Brevundimonas diminuta]|uniref:hypothetical protein n=1 Tax=Brevundimonas diminuta TaxID=293 RepID=UPI0030FA0B7D
MRNWVSSLRDRCRIAKKDKPLEDIIWAKLAWPVAGMGGFLSIIVGIIAIDYYNHLEGSVVGIALVDLFHEWQSLIGGILATVAALFAGRVITLQIARAETIEQARLEANRLVDERNTNRALMSARSVMPLTLNVLVDYTTAIAKAAIAVLDRSSDERIELTTEEMPELPVTPRAIIADLQAFIMAAPDAIGSNVADILSDLQLLSANSESTWERTTSEEQGEIVVKSNYEALVGRAAVLHARLASLYPYARRETEQAPGTPVEAKVATALQLWKIFPEIYPRCHATAADYLKKATSPAP